MIDPVCGMTVDPASAAGSHTHAGQTYYFCSKHCLERFAADPARFVTPPAPAPKPPPAPATSPGRPVDLPDASGDRARRAGRLPDLRHGARAARGDRRRGAEPGAGRHDARGSGSASSRRRRCCCSRWDAMVPGACAASCLAGHRGRGSSWRSRRRSCSGAAGRSSCAAGTRSSNRSPNMFTLIGARRRRRVRLQRGRDAGRPGSSRRRSATTTAASPSTSKPAAVIVTLVLLGQVLELRARGRTGARDPRAARGSRRRRARRVRADGGEEDVAARRRPCRRSPARPPGEKRSRRRRRRRGRERRRRIDGHRRADARRETRAAIA